MKKLPLHEIHSSLGAHFTQVLDWEVPAHYGDVKKEHLAVRKTAGIFDLSFRGRFRLTGPDRTKFLQGLITNDVQMLTEGQGLYAAILNPKGRMLSDLKVYAFQDSFILDMDREITDNTVQLLNRYKLVAKVKLEDLLDTMIHIAVHGPMATKILGSTLGMPLPQPPEFSCISSQQHGQEMSIIRSSYTGEEGYDILVAKNEGVSLWSELLKTGVDIGIQPVGIDALESLRVEAGIPRYGIDMDENTFPPEAGLEEKAISYTKGCYVGQETMARIKTYGQVHRKLMGLFLKEPTIESTSPEDSKSRLPRHSDKVFKDDQEIGSITSVVYSPTFNQNIAMGYIRRKLIQPDLEVTIVSGQEEAKITAQVVDLPFYKGNVS